MLSDFGGLAAQLALARLSWVMTDTKWIQRGGTHGRAPRLIRDVLAVYLLRVRRHAFCICLRLILDSVMVKLYGERHFNTSFGAL